MKKIQNVKSLLAIIVASVFGVGVVHAQTLNWTGEDYTKNFSGYYYIKCFSGNKFMAANGTNGKLVSGHTNATVFTFDYQQNDTYDNEFNISYDNNGNTNYINSNKTSGKWGTSSNKWNFNWVESKSGYTFNRRDSYIWLDDTHFTITYNYSNNSIAYAETNANDYADDSRVWQLISVKQVEGTYPANISKRLEAESQLTGIKYALVKGLTYSTIYDDAESMWLTKQHLTATSTSFTVTGINNETYILEIHAKKIGSGTAKIVANGVYSDPLTEETKLYQLVVPVTGNKITVSFDTTDEVDACFTLKAIASQDDIEARNMITWSPEKAISGDFYLKRDTKEYNAYLTAISEVKDDIENSTLFNFNCSSDGKSAVLSYDKSGTTNYVFDNATGRTSWGTKQMSWSILEPEINKYTFSFVKRDKYYIQSDGNSVQYTTSNTNNTWQLISKKQHDDISARSLEQSLSSLGKNVRAYWQTPIKTSLVGDRWYAYTNEANTKGASYNQIKIVGLKKKSLYLVEVEGRRGNVGNANIYVEGQSEPLTGNLETYYIPVYSTYGNITVRVQWDSDVTGEIWSAVKSITPMTDNGVPDDIIKNPYFAIHQTNAWSKNWSITNYSRAVAGYEKEGSLGYEGNGFYAVQRGMTSNRLNVEGKTTGRIYQTLTSLPAGIYTLSADVVSKNCKSTLFISKTNNVDIWSLELSDIDTKTNKSITFFVPEPIKKCRVGYKYVVDDLNDDEVISAVDNFRLIRQTNADKGVADAYLTNAYFALPQGTRTWDYGWTNNGFSPSICGGENGFEGSGLCAERTGCNNNDQETHRISQVVNLPKGTYVLSADVIAMDRIGHIYAKVGNDVYDQYCYGPESRYTLEFNIQESTDVEVGFYSDVQGVNYGENNSQYLGPTWDNDVTYRVAVDNFRLISSDDYLENADFSDGWNHWAHTENATISLVEGLGHGNYVQTNTVWESNSTGNCIYANDINQTVSLPAGAYQLSANGATNNVITCLYAKIGDRMQRMYVPSSKWQTTNPQFTFIVPTASDVTVGLSFEKTYGNDVSVKMNYFHLIRIGDAEGTDITSQIVNANLLANNDELPNDKYGWSTGTGKDFRAYSNDVAEVFYNIIAWDASTFKTYKITQKINGLPDGWYRLTAQGFYRDGAGKTGSGTSNASSTFGFDDPDQARAHLIAGNYYTPIQSLYSENATGSDDNGRPFDMTQARAAFDQGYYNNNSVVGKAVNGVLEIGVRREDAIDHDWLCLNNFKLYYMYDENAFPEVAGSLKDPSFEENNNAKAWEPSFTNWVTVGNWQSINQTEYNNLSNTNYIGYGVREMADNEKSVYHGDYIFFAKNNYVQLTSGYNRYYKRSTKRTINIGQTVTDLPSGEYTLKAQVKVTSASNSKAHLSITSNGETINAYSTSSNPEWLSVISDVGSDGKMTISLEMSLTTGDSILVDNFILEKTGGDVYVYNCEAGAFISTAVNKGLSKNPANFSTTGAKLRMSARGVTEGMRSFEYNNQYLNVSNIVNGNSRYEYLTYETYANATHNEFKVTTPEGSNISTICVNPADDTYGTTANIVNAGSASAYNGKYGTTYMGWTGETGFDVVYPLIPENDKAGRGTKWRVLDESQYNKYKNTIAAAHEARMAAWSIYCSARRSTYSVDVTRFEDVYNNISSTAEAINKVAKELKVQLESELLLNNATVDDYVDVTYLVSDIDFKEATLNNWNNEGGKFVYSESTNHVTDKIFGGRHYAAISDDALGNAKLTVTIPNLRSGKYAAVLTVSAYAGGDEVEGVAAVAGDEEAFRSIDIEPTSYNIYNVVIPRFTVDDNHKNAVVGIKLTGTNATSVEIGNLTLRYLGPVHSAADDYDYTLDDNVLTYIGNWPVAYEAQEYFNYSLDANKNVCTIYLKEDGFDTDFDMTFDADKFTNKNLLIYKKPGQENIHILNMTSNIVEGDECDEYVLVDKNDISIPEAFTAKNASYKRTGVTSNYGTLCLPFEFSMEDGTKLYDFGGFQANNGEINIIIEPVDKVEACRPCIFKKADDSVTELSIEGNNVTISEAKPDTVDVDGFKLIGAFNKHTFGDITEQDKTAAIDYYYIAKDKFWHATDYFTNGAFRSYIYTGGKLEDIFGVHDVRSIGFYEFMDEEATSVDGVDSDSEIVGYYNLNGQQIDTPTSGVVIVKYSDGKYRKVMVKQK